MGEKVKKLERINCSFVYEVRISAWPPPPPQSFYWLSPTPKTGLELFVFPERAEPKSPEQVEGEDMSLKTGEINESWHTEGEACELLPQQGSQNDGSQADILQAG